MNLRVDWSLIVSDRHEKYKHSNNETYCHCVQSPLGGFLAQAPPLDVPGQRNHSFRHNVEIGLGLYRVSPCISRSMLRPPITSIVSNTLITPGCLSVRDLRTAFLANGRRDLFAAISKVKMLQGDPSSYMSLRVSSDFHRCAATQGSECGRRGWRTYPLGRIVKGPNRFGNINSVSKRVRK